MHSTAFPATMEHIPPFTDLSISNIKKMNQIVNQFGPFFLGYIHFYHKASV